MPKRCGSARAIFKEHVLDHGADARPSRQQRLQPAPGRSARQRHCFRREVSWLSAGADGWRNTGDRSARRRKRRFLEDGDEITLCGFCQKQGTRASASAMPRRGEAGCCGVDSKPPLRPGISPEQVVDDVVAHSVGESRDGPVVAGVAQLADVGLRETSILRADGIGHLDVFDARGQAQRGKEAHEPPAPTGCLARADVEDASADGVAAR